MADGTLRVVVAALFLFGQNPNQFEDERAQLVFLLILINDILGCELFNWMRLAIIDCILPYRPIISHVRRLHFSHIPSSIVDACCKPAIETSVLLHL